LDASFEHFVHAIHNGTDVRGREAVALSRELAVAGRRFPVDICRHPRARRYVLRVTTAGRLALTVPRGASISGGMRFASRQVPWIEREWRRLEVHNAEWNTGTLIWFRGERVSLEVHSSVVTFGRERVALRPAQSVRSVVEQHVREIAAAELPGRAHALACERDLAPVAASVRNQKSRWGSCSTRGSIALNWRLLLMPAEVADYVILHELSHRRHPNHSQRFWNEVERLCPEWRAAERWLRKHGKDLL
jgi:predicted metal-dependent hydrolase